MKKSLMLVVALLAMASLMAAMAFTSASVTSLASFSVVNTDDALLALMPGEHQAARLESVAGQPKTLVIDWDKGLNGGEFGIQPNSEYEWEDLFLVKNNSEHKIDVEVYLDPNFSMSGTDVFFGKTRVAKNWISMGGTNKLTFSLEPGAEEAISTKLKDSGVTIIDGAAFKLMVDAEMAQ